MRLSELASHDDAATSRPASPAAIRAAAIRAAAIRAAAIRAATIRAATIRAAITGAGYPHVPAGRRDHATPGEPLRLRGPG